MEVLMILRDDNQTDIPGIISFLMPWEAFICVGNSAQPSHLLSWRKCWGNVNPISYFSRFGPQVPGGEKMAQGQWISGYTGTTQPLLVPKLVSVHTPHSFLTVHLKETSLSNPWVCIFPKDRQRSTLIHKLSLSCPNIFFCPCLDRWSSVQ